MQLTNARCADYRAFAADPGVGPLHSWTVSNPTFIKRTEAALETLHYHSNCPFLADRPASIGSFYLELGGDCEWNKHSGLGERDRIRDRGRTGDDALA